MDGLHYMLARQTPVVGTRASRPEDLARDDQLAPPDVFNCLAHHDFSVAARVDVGVIKEVDSGLISGHDTLAGCLGAHLPTKSDPGSQRQFANLETVLA